MKENQIYRKFWNLSLGSWSVASHMTNDGGCSDVVLRHSGVRNRSLVLAIGLALTSVTHAQSVKVLRWSPRVRSWWLMWIVR